MATLFQRGWRFPRVFRCIMLQSNQTFNIQHGRHAEMWEMPYWARHHHSSLSPAVQSVFYILFLLFLPTHLYRPECLFFKMEHRNFLQTSFTPTELRYLPRRRSTKIGVPHNFPLAPPEGWQSWFWLEFLANCWLEWGRVVYAAHVAARLP